MLLILRVSDILKAFPGMIGQKGAIYATDYEIGMKRWQDTPSSNL